MQTIELAGARLGALLEAIKTVRAVVVGDVCLDAYWMADMRLSTLSRETPHHNMPVVRERYALGGAGNVMANMRSLTRHVTPVTMLGEDWRGGLVRGLAGEMELSARGLITVPGRVTPAYVKPCRIGYSGVCYEDPRLDFENQTPPGEIDEARVIEALRAGAENAHVIAVSDQLSAGLVTRKVREELARIAAAGKIVVVDSRDRVALFPGCVVKPNELESARAAGLVPEAVTARAYMPVARRLREITGQRVIITLGGEGSMCFDGEEYSFAPARKARGPIDIVGAGDTFLSASALALGAGATLPEAIALGNLASAVTIHKLGQTGTASAQEILEQSERES